MKPSPLGTIWTARATLFGNDGKSIATCTDTPNAIAVALMQLPNAQVIRDQCGDYSNRADYANRMNDWNTVNCELQVIHV